MRARFVGVVAIVVVALAGCGLLPQPPDSRVPSPAPDASGPTASAQVGLTVMQRAAIRVRNVTCGGVGSGSGFALAEDLLVTNAHVIEGASVLQLNTYDGREIEVETSAAATVADLALVRTVQPLPDVVPIAEADPVVGDEVSVAGYPGGGPLRISTGTVLGYTEDALGVNLDQVFAFDAEVAPGSSGSAVVNADGRVVGVVYAVSDRQVAYAVPVSVLHTLLATPEVLVPLQPCH